MPVNRALQEARGAFVTHLDDDDEHEPTRVERLLHFMRETRADLSFHPFRHEDEKGNWVLNPAREFRYSRGNNLVHLLPSLVASNSMGRQRLYVPRTGRLEPTAENPVLGSQLRPVPGADAESLCRAVPGPVVSYLPFLRPLLVETDEIIPYLRRIDATRLYSNFGPLTLELEQRILSEYFGCAGLVSTVHNATAGLMLAIDAVRRPAGRYAIMPSFTFAAAPQAALWCGLEPYFVDIRAGDFCLDVQAVERAVEELGDALAVIVPYAAFGTVCDLDFYAQLQRGGRPVVVDAAASFGSSLNGHQFGAAFPGAVVFSFHATKSFGIGEGGMVYSSDEDLIARI